MCRRGAIIIVLHADITGVPIGAPIPIAGTMAGLTTAGPITADIIIAPTHDIIIGRAILIQPIIIRGGIGKIIIARPKSARCDQASDCAWPQKRQEFDLPSEEVARKRRAWEAT